MGRTNRLHKLDCLAGDQNAGAGGPESKAKGARRKPHTPPERTADPEHMMVAGVPRQATLSRSQAVNSELLDKEQANQNNLANVNLKA